MCGGWRWEESLINNSNTKTTIKGGEMMNNDMVKLNWLLGGLPLSWMLRDLSLRANGQLSNPLDVITVLQDLAQDSEFSM